MASKLLFLALFGLVNHVCGKISNITLVNSNVAGQGLVQIFRDGEGWGTICDDNFDRNAAKVVCKMVDPKSNTAAVTYEGTYGAGTGKIFIDEISCTGNEQSVEDCGSSPINDCEHSEDIGVICNSDGVLKRLVNANGTKNSGRLEVQINGQWGTVCDDEFTTTAAKVACREMGLPWQHAYVGKFGMVSNINMPIWYDDVVCTGTEASLLDCNMTLIGDNDCDHSEDVGVFCTDVEQHVQIRLVDGSTAMEGRVEVNLNGVWGTVCDDEWSDLDAKVICGMLGYTNGTARAFGQSFYGQGTGQIFMDDVICVGTEASVVDCVYGGFGNHDCDHSEDAGVNCNAGVSNLKIRLVGGANAEEGRVEVFHNNQWGTVCDDNFDDREAKVVCNMLGYSNGTSLALSESHFGGGVGSIFMDELSCIGNELSLDQCRFDGYGVNDCDHTEDAGVICNAVRQNLTARLVNGKNSNEGRLEVNYNGLWGTVCDDNFGANEARAVCRMLGLPSADAEALRDSFFGDGTGKIWLDNVDCISTSDNIANCRHNPFGVNNCDHTEDVGVRCGGTNQSPVRLVGGVGPFEGRLEVFHQERWGTVCSDAFDVNDAQVVCNLIGYPSSTPEIVDYTGFGAGNGPIWLDRVQCTGNETALDQCIHSRWGSNNCDHSKDVGIKCKSHGLTCYHCDGLSDPKTCNETIICAAGEACEEASYIVNGQTGYSLTCQSKLVCDALQSSTAVGKRQATGQTTRVRCCTTPLCNSNLLDVNPNGGSVSTDCRDAPGTDCNALDMTNFCANRDAAKFLCPKHCGLCT